MGLISLIVCPDIYMELTKKSLTLDHTVRQAYLSWVEATRIREKYGCEPLLGFVKTIKPVIIQAGTSREI